MFNHFVGNDLLLILLFVWVLLLTSYVVWCQHRCHRYRYLQFQLQHRYQQLMVRHRRLQHQHLQLMVKYRRLQRRQRRRFS